MMKLKIKPEALQQMSEHAEATYPNECCGFFFGSESGDARHVLSVMPVKNSNHDNPERRFNIRSEDYREAEQFADNHKLDLLGVYHSHPDHPAIASEHDRSVALPWFSYLIFSVMDGKTADVKSWRLTEERIFNEEEVEKPVETKNY